MEAARQFQRISKAADLLLHRVSAGWDVPCSSSAHVKVAANVPTIGVQGKAYDPQAAAQAASARQQWRQNQRYNEPRWTLLVR